MNSYQVSVNGITFYVEASNRATAIRRALNYYYHDDEVSERARRLRKRDSVMTTIEISIKRTG